MEKKLKLNYPQTIKVGLAFAIIMVFWTAYDFVMPLLLEQAYGLSNWMRGLIMGLDNLLSLFLLPIFGKISDKANGKIAQKYGKRTPFILIGTVISAALIILVPITSLKQMEAGKQGREEILKKLDNNQKTQELLEKFFDTSGSKYVDRGYLDLNKVTRDKFIKIRYDSSLQVLKGKEKRTHKGAYKYTFTTDTQIIKADGSIIEVKKGETKFVYPSDTIINTRVEGAGSRKVSEIINGNADYKKYVETGINEEVSGEIFKKVKDGKGKNSLIAYMFILLFALIAMATFRSPAVALMPDVTPKPLRSQANAMINLMGGVGGAIAVLIYTVALIKPVQAYTYTVIFVAVAFAMIALLLFFLGFVRERKLKEKYNAICEEFGITDEETSKHELEENTEETSKQQNISLSKKLEEKFFSKIKNLTDAEKREKLKKAKFTSFILILASIFMWFMGFNAVSSNISIYIVKTLNLKPVVASLIVAVSMGVSAVAFIPVGIMASKIGRRKSIIIGFICAAVAFVLIFLPIISKAAETGGDATKATLFALFYLVASFGLIIANVNTFPMVVELSTEDTIGKYTGYYYAATMSAQAITPFIAGAIMDKWGSKFLFLYSSLCVVVATIIILFVRYGDSVVIKKGQKLTKEEKKEIILESMGDPD